MTCSEAKSFLAAVAVPFEQWASYYRERRIAVGLLPVLGSVAKCKKGRRALELLGDELRRVREHGPIPLESLLLELRRGKVLPREDEILRAVLELHREQRHEHFTLAALCAHLAASRQNFFADYQSEKGRETHVGTILTHCKVPSLALRVDGRKARVRRFSDAFRAAERRGLGIQDCPDVATFGNEPRSGPVATFETQEPRSPLDSPDLPDLREALCTTREEDSVRRTLSEEETARLEGLPTNQAPSHQTLVEALDPEAREDYEERASIIQYEGEKAREGAEREALSIVLGRLAPSLGGVAPAPDVFNLAGGAS